MSPSLSASHDPSDMEWSRLSELAWEARERSRVHGTTCVGAAVLSRSGNCFAGCNVEHRFRSHDMHAEVNALTSMVTAGDAEARVVLIASDRERFTPCGACLDWIFELGGPDTLVAFERSPGGERSTYPANELMPYYPY